MPRTIKLLSLTALVTTVAAIGWWLAVNEPIQAVCLCPDPLSNATAIHWGKGATCNEAEDDLRSQTSAAAINSCGGLTKTCLGNLVITQSCYWNSTYQEYVVDGYQIFDCKDCGPPSP